MPQAQSSVLRGLRLSSFVYLCGQRASSGQLLLQVPTLPFNAFGTMALARSEFETNSGSSQIFWLLKVALHAADTCSHMLLG